MMSLKVGEKVLVESSPTRFRYEPVLAFLHEDRGPGRALEVTLSDGKKLKASDHHLVFIAGTWGVKRLTKRVDQLHRGDLLYTIAHSGLSRTSAVVGVRRVLGSGMFAPLTAAGTVVVDHVVASAYAAPGDVDLPHGAAHAAFFLLRAYFSLGVKAAFAPLSLNEETPNSQPLEQMNAYAAFLFNGLGLAKLLS